jgi:F-type H+-transporting ATPase subunit b
LRELDEKARSLLGDALRKNSESALIRSTFDLPAAQQAAIQNALNETFSAEIHIRFETAPDLVSGIELTTNGQKVGWSIADYLASLEKGVGDLLKEKDKPEAKAEPKPEIKASPKPQTIPEPKPEIKVEPNTAAKAEPNGKADINAKIEAEPKPATEKDLKPKAGAEAKVEELEPVLNA